MQLAMRVPELIVAPRNNPNVADLALIDDHAAGQIEAMVRSAGSIRKAAAELVAAGVMMAEIRSRAPDAWTRFIEIIDVNTKGEGGSYREIARVLFRRFRNSLQGDGQLINRTISRSQVSRYGKAIEIAHGWPERGAKLVDRIIGSRGVWAIAKLAEEKHEHRRRISSPGRPSKTITLDQPTSPTLVLVLPDGAHRLVPALIANPIIKRMLQ